jgi:uncharacterized protein (TIGR02300 family)
MTTASQAMKAMRGTKRVCAACGVRFYDLVRDPIVCPSCGEVHAPVAREGVGGAAHGGSFTEKTSWRGRSFKRTDPVPPAADIEPAVASEAAEAEDLVEETPGAVAEDDIVLEQETDDGDVSGWVDRDVEEPKE